MFNLFKKEDKNGTRIVFKLSGLHCSSCALSIDNTLEEIDGVFEAKTSYSKAKTVVYFDLNKTNEKSLKRAIQGAGYQVVD